MNQDMFSSLESVYSAVSRIVPVSKVESEQEYLCSILAFSFTRIDLGEQPHQPWT